MANWESRVTCNETYVSGGAENYSNVAITFQIRRTDYRMNGYNNTGSANWSIACNGQHTGNIYFNFNWNNNPAGSWWTVGSYSFKIPHNSDGSKTISYSAYFSTGISPSSFSASGSKTLTKIPRYASFTKYTITNITQTSLQINWDANAGCKEVQYQVNNGSWQKPSFSKSFALSNLAPNTKYNIKIKILRSDSNLWTNSSVATVTTLPIATISNSILFNIGESIHLTFANYKNNSSFLRLYQKNMSNSWVKIGEVTGVNTASYDWNITSYADTMYNNTPNSNKSEVKIVCGVTLNGKEYTKETIGTATVTNSNPIFSNFVFENTDSKSSTLLGNTTSMITYSGNLRVRIPSANKASGVHYASIMYYNISTTIDNTTTVKKVDESTSDLSVDFGSFTASGNCIIRAEAVDSRGNISTLVEKTMTVYKYHNPTMTTSLTRINGFEQETSLTITGYISRVNVSGTDKNTLKSLSYRYRENGGNWSSNKTLDVSSSIVGDDKKVSYADSNFLTIPNNKSYEFEFILVDGLNTYTFTDSIGQGIPVAGITDNKKVLVNIVPDNINLQREESLIVGSDISAKDTNGEQKPIFKEMRNMIIMSEEEPDNQVTGGIWLQVVKTINLNQMG